MSPYRTEWLRVYTAVLSALLGADTGLSLTAIRERAQAEANLAMYLSKKVNDE